MKRFKIKFWLRLYTAAEGVLDEHRGDCYMNGPDLGAIEQTAYVMLSEEFLKQKLTIRGLMIEEIEETFDIPDSEKGPVVTGEFKIDTEKPE